MGKLERLGLKPVDIRLASGGVQKVYCGAELVWEPGVVGGGGDPMGPKIDPNHPLANQEYMVRLTNGQLEGMTNVQNHTIVDNAFASSIAGTVAFVREGLISPPDGHLRISARIKVDKTSGRHSFVGFSSVADPTASSADFVIGHQAGIGITIKSMNFAFSASTSLLSEAQCVDGAWYDVSLVWSDVGVLDERLATDTTNAGPNRLMSAALPIDPVNEPVDISGNNWFFTPSGSRMAPSHVPTTLIARTNSPLGTIKDLHYVDNMLGVTGDNALVVHNGLMGDGTVAADQYYVWSKAKAAPLRLIITAGGSGVYGGMDFSAHYGRSGHPYVAWRKLWRDLADLGYTVLHTHALHEGWGADDHLMKQLEAYNLFDSQFLLDSRLYYLGYSMGGASFWRAVRGRAGFPSIAAAYLVAGISNIGMYYDNASFPNIKTRWPGGAASIDEPQSWPAADLIARGTRIRMVTSTADTNVPKATHHDPMFAKYAGSGLASEYVHDGIAHFDPEYWNALDIVNFFENVDNA